MPHSDELLSRLVAPPAPAAIVVGASPYTFTAPYNGCVVVSGGTVSLVQLGRAGVFLATGVTTGVFPVSAGDQIKVTYTVAPTMNFLPTLR
jgi:hypothetical protein